MFLGGLSMAKEMAAARSSTAAGGGSGATSSSSSSSASSSSGRPHVFTKIEGFEEDEEEVASRIKPCELRLFNKGEKGPLLYVGVETAPPREVIIEYLRDCSALMLDPSWLSYIIRENDAKSGGSAMPLHFSAMEFQRQVMEHNFQIEPNFGCGYLSNLPKTHADDVELLETAKAFMFTALRSYLECVSLRTKTHPKYKGPLRTGGGFPKNNMLEFFEACNAKMSMPETKAFLKGMFAKTGQMPGSSVIQIQRRLIEHFGITADYGVSQLNLLGQQDPKDRDMELISKMQQFAMCAQMATKEACFTEVQREEFYKEIPIFMHHVPYMHAAQKSMEMQRDMQRQATQMSGQLEELKSQPGNVIKMIEFSKRAKMAGDAVTGQVATWDAKRREEFWDNFNNNDSLMLDIINSGASLSARLAKFSQLTQDEIERMMTLTAVLAEDMRARGKIMQELSKGSIVQSLLQSWAAIVRTGAQLQQASIHSGTMDHNHSHAEQGHVHGPNCSHDHGSAHALMDVTSGKTAEMER